MDNSQTLFLMHITDGYSFRNTIGIIKSEIEYATMVLSEKLITISFVNTSKCAVHKLLFYPQEFSAYRYNVRDDNGNLFPEYPIAFETNEMFNTTKGIGRRDGVRLYWLAGDNKINVQPIKTSIKDPGRAGALFVKIHPVEYIKYDVGLYPTNPNIRVQAKDFADLCSQSNIVKCTCLEIVGQKNGVTFRGIHANQGIAFLSRIVSQTDVSTSKVEISNLNEIDNLLDNLHIDSSSTSISTGMSLNVVKSEDLMTVRVPLATVKALSKFHNISPSGTLLKFFFSENKPTKIESPIGTYGLYSLYIRNLRQPTSSTNQI